MKLSVGDIAKQLPGRKQSTLNRITKNLPTGALKNLPTGALKNLPAGTLKNLPGGRAIGTAGGVLVGAGAAVAATQAVNRMKNERRTSSSDESSSSASESANGEVARTSKQSSPSKQQSDQPEQGGGKKKGIFAKLFKRGGGGAGSKKVKVTNIVEEIDIGAPRRLVYDQWTQFQDFPTFMKKVISVDQTSDEKLNWKAKIFWSNRAWESTIIEQLPDKRIVWRSTGSKGHVDGAVTFHRVAPNLTRVVLVLEYHPQGFFEHTGNLWRSQGRRARLELKHFKRHVMTHSLLKADEIEGWRGEIRDSEVVMTHEEGLAAEEKGQKEGSDQYEESYDREPAKASTSAKTADEKQEKPEKKPEKEPEKEPQASR